MTERGAMTPTPPEDWPAHPDPILALNGMGTFDWDLDSGRMYVDAKGYQILNVPPEEYDGIAFNLGALLLPAEAAHIDTVMSDALKSGAPHYGAYFRVRDDDGTLRWAHTQGYIRRDDSGRPRRILGVLRDATRELDEVAARPDHTPRGEEQQRRTSVVQRTTAALAHARTVQDVIDVLQDGDRLLNLGASSLVMGLVEAGSIRLVTEGAQGYTVPGTEVNRIEEPYPMTEAVRTLKPRFVESPDDFAASYPILWPHLSHLGITSAAYLPLIVQARPIGALGLIYLHKTGFSDEERNVLLALSSSIAQCLQRAMFFEHERDLASGLQQAMLPRTIPEVPGAEIAVRYRSAALGRDIGGDWYDVIPLPGGRLGVVIGDVQGHDTHAAAVMGQLRIVLRAYATEGHTPAAAMARASAFLHELDTERFATCLYAEIDLATGVLQLVRAGHLNPLLRGTDGSCRRLPVQGGLPLGLATEFDQLAYPVVTMELDPGQTLLLCTDGLVEHSGNDLDDGLQSLITMINTAPKELPDLADLLTDSLDAVRGKDDMALLLLRRRATEAPQLGGRLQQHVPAGDAEALAEARHMIRAAVQAWSTGERADEIELVAGELINNSLIHTGGAAVVTLRMLAGSERRLRIEVEDGSSALPRRREAGESGLSGRGLLLVDRLADVWGVESRGSGKCVWGEFVVPPRE
ncbi:SpoIIE family protein phosphatase [Streptomyces odontomachi]|uniref:SpoIIE family protein phosphatase n=1 Tax=Streptomyces odontomachi TaxID=2944940 RepID=UPI00210D9E1E|nr:SpoIIE family protein phosphatase [Streptomyces sp. ODS25]